MGMKKETRYGFFRSLFSGVCFGLKYLFGVNESFPGIFDRRKNEF